MGSIKVEPTSNAEASPFDHGARSLFPMLLALLAGACIGQLDIERGCFTCIVGATAGISTSPCRCCAINSVVVARGTPALGRIG